MKNIIILIAFTSLTIFTACNNQKIEGDIVPTIEKTTDRINIEKTNKHGNYLANIGEVNFTINNENNSLLEQDLLLLSNNSKNAVSYHWDFGNGDTSTKAQPNYKYEIHGYYTVTLTITDAFGSTHQTSNEILVLCLFGGGDHDQ